MRYKLTNRLAECLASKGVKKSQLAFWLKMSRASVTRLERGEVRPSIQTALRIASYFKKPVEEIFQLVEGTASDEESLKSNLFKQFPRRPRRRRGVREKSDANKITT